MLARLSVYPPAMELPMKAAITVLTGLSTVAGGLVLRACGSGAGAELSRYWCGPKPMALLSEAQAHCAGCGMIAAGLLLMIAGTVASRLPRRCIARENA